MIEKKLGQLTVKIYLTRKEMGAAAAAEAAAFMRELQAGKDEINCVFAAAPSQNEFLAALAAEKGIAWDRVNAFHMDEYIGLLSSDPRSFAAYLDGAIFSRVPFKSVNLMNGMNDGAAECRRYAGLIAAHPIDIVFMGIGENGHIAFNDPPVANFEDPLTVKTVELEQACRQQQVNDGCFPDLDAVPKFALTLTIPALVNVKRMFCVVPGERKAAATAVALTGPIALSCPASILRTKSGATMYLDTDAASKVTV
jgi:glucosamine-6-phosphate deaminase